MPGLQSVYRRGHSTETAILKIISDLLMATDRGQVAILGLFDLSAAFDKVDHIIIIDRVRHSLEYRALHCLVSSHSSPTERRQSVSLAVSHQLHL